MHTHTFHVSGTHCAACKMFIEDTLREVDQIHSVDVDLAKQTVQVQTESDQNAEALAEMLTKHIQSNGYAMTVQKASVQPEKKGDIWTALPIGLAVLALFFLLQRSGILELGIGGQITPFASFLIGLVASVSSCLAIVGGLVLSLSANVTKDGASTTKIFGLFHVGRIVSFAVLGGVLGAVGGALGVNFTVAALLGLLASVVMIALGLNLVGFFSNSTFSLPPSVFRFFKGIEHKTLSPLLLGFATFFLPCGFTQSMQFSALSSGSFMSGLLIMTSFVFGTFPVLALLSFGTTSFARSKYAALFFQSVGIVVIGLGVFAFLTGLAGLGVIPPLFSI